MPADQTSSARLDPEKDKTASFHRRVLRWTGPSSYATGGETLDATVTGCGRHYAVNAAIISNGSAIRVGWFDRANGKILWFVPNTGAEVANATDLSGFVGQVEIIAL